MSAPPVDTLAWHWVGGLLLGAYDCPNSVPDAVEDHRLRRIVEAVIGVSYVDEVWPVDVGRVLDVLRYLGVFEEIGGDALLLDLMETWSGDRALLILGEIESWARFALVHLRDKLAAKEALVSAIERHEPARSKSHETVALARPLDGRPGTRAQLLEEALAEPLPTTAREPCGFVIVVDADACGEQDTALP